MKCPYCGYPDTKVLDKRETIEGDVTRRRRECLKCKKRFTTYERVETLSLTVVKKDGRREAFDRNKLIAGMLKACEKRPISREEIEKIADDIEARLRMQRTTEVSSRDIGNMVMKKLKKLDKVAYIRFASVYKEFGDLEDFQRELKRLLRARVK
ncbi:transcriptional regulator NrdR [Candidatus Aerophobetes bacterium]|uniref:Transcriptional repressor NrdR n=1 Tax=Aerophobetes bacterium TaxID=2030807 RepID=A0A662DFF8_UNCAE|nr:MAG: transcriptional regulator NrdR [Candidatus Aerophobetes bacterium]